jgi:hypothetical protein
VKTGGVLCVKCNIVLVIPISWRNEDKNPTVRVSVQNCTSGSQMYLASDLEIRRLLPYPILVNLYHSHCLRPVIFGPRLSTKVSRVYLMVKTSYCFIRLRYWLSSWQRYSTPLLCYVSLLVFGMTGTRFVR